MRPIDAFEEKGEESRDVGVEVAKLEEVSLLKEVKVVERILL